MNGNVFGVIAPHPPIMVESVGGARARVTADSIAAMRHAARLLAKFDPQTVVIMSPHSPAVADAFVVETADHTRGSLDSFGASDVDLTYRGDPVLAERLLERLDARGIPAIDRAAIGSLKSGQLDHGVLVPMSFLDPAGDYALLNLSLSYRSYADHIALGEEVRSAAEDMGRRIAFVASGDCSHRLTPDAPAGYDPSAAAFDKYLVDTIRDSGAAALADTDSAVAEAAGECGLRSFITLGGLAPDAPTEILAYEGPWGVGYLSAIVGQGAVPSAGTKAGMPGSQEHAVVALAREAVTRFITEDRIITPEMLHAPELPKRAGVFVSLHRNDALRGCIGTIAPTRATLAEEIVRNAIEACSNDPRFERLTPEELDDLEISVDILHEPEPTSLDGLDPARYGVIVSNAWRRGLLLPDLEGVDSVQDQVTIARRKAGIADSETVELQRFRVDRYA